MSTPSPCPLPLRGRGKLEKTDRIDVHGEANTAGQFHRREPRAQIGLDVDAAFRLKQEPDRTSRNSGGSRSCSCPPPDLCNGKAQSK